MTNDDTPYAARSSRSKRFVPFLFFVRSHQFWTVILLQEELSGLQWCIGIWPKQTWGNNKVSSKWESLVFNKEITKSSEKHCRIVACMDCVPKMVNVHAVRCWAFQQYRTANSLIVATCSTIMTVDGCGVLWSWKVFLSEFSWRLSTTQLSRLDVSESKMLRLCYRGGGWSGENCQEPPRCPGATLPCSGRGECLSGGTCRLGMPCRGSLQRNPRSDAVLWVFPQTVSPH